ncbi:MAG: aldo/keto reductase [Planctomycetaceae bacterium]|jgi:aryl-alcohol dehydrogenase-like predicted oxidoreductase|nr:aldo/keto reductase [Planctomycetaceae bacterium]
MQYRNIGKTDIKASVIGFGTFPLGGWLWGGVDESAAVTTIQKAINAGINLIDTAPLYGNGKAEEIVGKAIAGRRDKVVLATKCGSLWSTEEWPEGKGQLFFYTDGELPSFTGGKYRIYNYLRPESIVREVEESLRRLKTDYIDLLQTHQQDATTPIADTMAALEKLREQGKIRAIGCSNVSRDQLQQYCDAGTLASTQEYYSYLNRSVEQNGVLTACTEKKISFLAYTSLEQGLLTGTLDPKAPFGEKDFRKYAPSFAPERIEKINAALARLQPIRDRHGLTVSQLMLAWVLSRYERMHVLCGMRNPNRIDENVRAGDVQLTAEEMDTMQSLFDPVSVG